ncbi:interleukin-1 receptor-associated kinase 1-binding protein 1 homolog [Austrofundulus limnaeus]|uniref:Interleukin-1 receptor-associated kinase 1-binding protein 1 homolog n=1 Tax=Austrofundulus limnaeus TaxID=52670 RepID=A0A2I4C3Z9_AUSLI|nr:PREDICTED: interleukin-1 receptor-associated kinase 1-binding protein 1 [Austrofundulus limnaeus]
MNKRSTRVFTAKFAGGDQQQEHKLRADGREGLGGQMREVQVIGMAEVTCPADRASLRVSVSSIKESVNEVTESVTRRLDYILQALRQHFVTDADTSVRRFLHREADTYTMDVEVVVTFSSFETMEQICSILLEKLDKSVHVAAPQFYHSPGCLSQARERACESAVQNAQEKAFKIIGVLGIYSLGLPLLVREEETKEWRNEEDNGDKEQGLPLRFPHIPTVTVSSLVSVSYRAEP